MTGHRFIVGGNPSIARNTAFTVLANHGFALTMIDEWTAVAQRGSLGTSIALGAFAGKRGRHVKLRIVCQTAPDGFVIMLIQETSGFSGGLIGVSQASDIYTEIYNAVGFAFQNAGILISGGYF